MDDYQTRSKEGVVYLKAFYPYDRNWVSPIVPASPCRADCDTGSANL